MLVDNYSIYLYVHKVLIEKFIHSMLLYVYKILNNEVHALKFLDFGKHMPQVLLLWPPQSVESMLLSYSFSALSYQISMNIMAVVPVLLLRLSDSLWILRPTQG